MNVAIIPARGGSKRIPRKNIRPFCGKPMITWPIETAQASGLFKHIVVSTDDDEIAQVAIDSGAVVPFRRPAHLADDYTATIPVVSHAIAEVERIFDRPERVCCIYPTAVFMRADDMCHGLELLMARCADFAFPVTSFPYPIRRALKLTSDGGVAMVWPEYRLTRSQAFDETYHDAGQFYWGRTDAFLDEKDLFSSNSVPIILPRYRVHDLDTEEDLLRAELMFQALAAEKEGHNSPR